LLLRRRIERRRRHHWPRHGRCRCRSHFGATRRINSSNRDSSSRLLRNRTLSLARFLRRGCLRRVVAQLHVQQLQVDLALDDVALTTLAPLQPLQDGARRVQVVAKAAHALEGRAVVLTPPARLRPVGRHQDISQ
jgi:hypothetical protein